MAGINSSRKYAACITLIAMLYFISLSGIEDFFEASILGTVFYVFVIIIFGIIPFLILAEGFSVERSNKSKEEQKMLLLDILSYFKKWLSSLYNLIKSPIVLLLNLRK